MNPVDLHAVEATVRGARKRIARRVFLRSLPAPHGRGKGGLPICTPGTMPDWRKHETCCENEDRDMNGWCKTCGCPCY